MSSDKYSQERRSAFSSGHAIQSFRNLDFNPISSICEIIDNSQQAGATEIKIDFEWEPHPDGGRYAAKSIFIDNGDGMDEKILYNYLILGESEKKTLKSGIGKFGVGATLAGISTAKHIDVYSLQKGGKWMYTYLDIDEIEAQGDDGGIPKPVQQDPDKELMENLEHGTIVIWSNVDVIEEALLEENLFPPNPITNSNQLHNEEILSTEVGRTYRKFMTPERWENGKLIKNENPLTITVQKQEVEPYDPIYATYNPRTADTEKPTLQYNEYPIRFGQTSAKMKITTSYLPESWWVNAYRPGNDVKNRERKIGTRNEGFSLVREGREIFFGRIPYPYFIINDPGPERHSHSWKEHDRWIAYEIEFSRDADDIFNIQANKSKLDIRKVVRQELSKKLSNTIVQGRVEFHKKTGAANAKQGKGKGSDPGKGKKKIQKKLDPKYNTEEKKQLHDIALKYVKDKKYQKEIDDAYNDLVNGYLPIADYAGDATDQMVKYSFEKRSIIVKYNMNHPFLKKFVDALTDIGVKLGKNSTETLSVPENQTLRTLFDILFVSYGLARVSFDNLSREQEIQTTVNRLHQNWGQRAEEFARKDLESTEES